MDDRFLQSTIVINFKKHITLKEAKSLKFGKEFSY